MSLTDLVSWMSVVWFPKVIADHLTSRVRVKRRYTALLKMLAVRLVGNSKFVYWMVVDAVMMGLPEERVLLMNVLEGNGLAVRIREPVTLTRWTLCGVIFQWSVGN